MKVHFNADPTGDKELYKDVYATIEMLGHTVVTDHALKQTKEGMEQETPEQVKRFHRDMRRWIHEADVVIFDATIPTLSLGFEVGVSFLLQRKPTVVLYNTEVGFTWTVGHGFKALDSSETFLLFPYSRDNIRQTIKDVLTDIASRKSPRFNFIITEKIEQYLDWVAQEEKLDRSAYLRQLITREMASSSRYQRYLSYLAGESDDY